MVEVAGRRVTVRLRRTEYCNHSGQRGLGAPARISIGVPPMADGWREPSRIKLCLGLRADILHDYALRLPEHGASIG